MAAPSRCTARIANALGGNPTRRIATSLRDPTPRIAARTLVARASSAPLRTCQRQAQTTEARRQFSSSSHRQLSGTFHRQLSSTSHRQALKTIGQIKARNKGGPFNITAALLFIATAGGLWAYFTYEKERMARKRIAEQTKGVGKPKVGGPFALVDQDGNVFSSTDMLGKYSLVYFGFTHCPDICPDELDKMALMYDKVRERCGDVLLPLMITCDPARDSPAVLKEYLAEFHPHFIGLTGNHEQIKDTCKAYRVYFSTPKDVAPGQDYLVDHSIYFYLMDPEGDFVEAIGRNFTADQAAKVIADHVKDWEKPLKKESRWE
ncbi:mitochondrial metallochaperone Sco1 [Didymella exigua CBS 183.55]|uniref:Mitochondrial metallochaperone Sco1 n=1 Tax=Didymella exigua CBS 183.55 TaxID=1150837 RepID=A0A6A5S3T6_9PLEO|nr:mitochondrial metallochaperone Sco1 [Didymella exigua CBS 183.55]KAF1934429.1 mitochondrial metallochaperone Sco1 [Didymella exigua CBS 183.55]